MNIKLRWILLKTLFLILPLAFGVTGRGSSDDGIWTKIAPSELRSQSPGTKIAPGTHSAFRLNRKGLETLLRSAPIEALSIGSASNVVLSIPMPDGSYSRFAIKESPIMEPGLAARFPRIKTYLGQGLDDPAATSRFDLTPHGFHAIVLSVKGTIYVEPYSRDDTSHYVSFRKSDYAGGPGAFYCRFEPKAGINANRRFSFAPQVISNGDALRTYRLALAATGEYTNAVPGTGTVADAVAAMTTTMNRVNGIYERELAVRMILVADNNMIIYTDGTTDPYTNTDTNQLVTENQTNIDAVIGSDNYDIGHVFAAPGRGTAGFAPGALCDANKKAQGATGRPDPTGDVFDVDFVSHEMGHQFGANHTFNGDAGSCLRARFAATAYEPASGSTIMAYAGICPGQDLQPNSSDNFHVASLEEILDFLTNTATCGVGSNTGNTPPSIGSFSITVPKDTPFLLTSNGTDPDTRAALTYSWEEYDLGPAGLPDPAIDGPVFRVYPPSVFSSRTFPSLQYILNSANMPPLTYDCALGADRCTTGEVLPSISRTMNFQVTVRDNQAGGGGIATAAAQVTVDGNSGPFRVTSPNAQTIWPGLSTQTVTWDVANTDVAPVSAGVVKILMSTNGGQTFPVVLAQSTLNDGSHQITVPNLPSTSVRIKVQQTFGVFFDISDENLTIAEVANQNARFDFDGDNKTDISIFRPLPGEWWYLKSSNGQVGAAQFGASDTKIVPADYTGDGKTDIAFFNSDGKWNVLRSEDSTFYAFPFGTTGDIPAPGDFDGDGIDDAAVYRPDSGLWFILRSSDSGVTSLPFGVKEDRPVVADYDGDGKDDVAIYRPSVQEWWILGSSAGVSAFKFGFPGAKAVPGDYTGDGKADVAFWNPADKRWYILRSEDSSFYAFTWGVPTDTPVPGDYDGDALMDAAVWRESNATWYILGSTSGLITAPFGAVGDIPVPSAYVVPDDTSGSSNLVVTKTADTDDGTCDSDCSLREAIATANSTQEDDIIEFDASVFSSPQQIILGGTQLRIENKGSLSINGTGTGLIEVSGNNNSRVFLIDQLAKVTINDIAITGGNQSGLSMGGSSDVTLNRVSVTGNTGVQGAGISNVSGALKVNNSIISNNSGQNGGGIHSLGGTVSIFRTEISGNTSSAAGAGVFNSSATMTITESTINGNQATDTTGGGTGAGIMCMGSLDVFRSTISNNTAGNQGGGIYHPTATTINLTDTTISGNSAGGVGGGISHRGSPITMVNSTVTNNTSTGRGGGVSTIGQFNAINSIFANNTDQSGLANDFSGTLISQGYNIIKDIGGTTITGTTAGNQLNVDPGLGPLQDNGGPTETHALQSGSAAIDAGSSPGNILDQRGRQRPFDDAGVPNVADGSDIGAFERQQDDLRASGREKTVLAGVILRGFGEEYLDPHWRRKMFYPSGLR